VKLPLDQSNHQKWLDDIFLLMLMTHRTPRVLTNVTIVVKFYL